MPFSIISSSTVLARNAGALYNVALSNSFMTSLATQAGSTNTGIDALLNSIYANSVGNATPAAVADELILNLGITAGTADAKAYIVGVLNATPVASRGAAVNGILTMFSQLTDATYGGFATAFNAKVVNSEAYSATTTNTTTSGFVTLSTTAPAVTFTLTTGIDILTGNVGNDTFIGDVTTLSAADTINGGSGTDTINIVGAVAAAAATPVATETASVLFAALSAAIQTVTVAGLTVTSTNAGFTAAQVAQVMSGGAAVAGLTLSGALNGWTAAVTGTATAVYTSITPANNVANITVAGSVAAPVATTSEGSAGVAATTATPVPVLNSIENVVFTTAGNGVTFSASAVAGVTGVTFDSAAGAANTVTVTTGQSVTLSNTAVLNTTTIAGNTPTSLTLNLNKVGQTSGATNTIDFSGTALTTVNISGSGTKSAATLTNTGAKIDTLNINGAVGITLIENAATSAAIKTINASTATGAVSVDGALGAKTATFAFTGGSANDTLKLAAGDLALLTSGAQLNGGSGTGDKLVTLDTTFAATDYAKINATVGFEVLGTGAAAAVVDAAQLTSIKSFAIDGTGIQAYTNLVTGSSFSISAAHAATLGISTATGVSDVAIAVGTATTTGFTIGGTVTLAGATTVALSSNGTNAAANVITTLTNVVNSNITITGSNDLTITNALVGTLGATGSAVNAAAFTGKLTVTGSGAGDIITGGSGADTITGGQGSDIVTGGAGADTFVFSGAAAANTSGVVFGQADVITDFLVGTDKLQFTTVTDIVSVEQIAVQAAVTALAAGSTATQIATAMATASTTALGVSVATFGGNTYVLYETTAAGVGVAADDVFIQLTGVASGFTFANSVIA